MVRRGRDPSPIEPMFQAHFDAIYRYAACRVGREAGLDIAAETFAQALRSLDRLDHGRNVRPWLFGIATNVLRHHHRAEVRRLRAYARVAHRDGPPTPGWSDEEAAMPGRERLLEALVQLDRRDREALLLFAWVDLSYEEIAAALAIPIGTVRSRIHRARQTLRSAVECAEDSEHFARRLAVGEEV